MENIKNEKDIEEHLITYLTNFKNLPCGLAVVKNDASATVLKANNTFYKIIGHSQEEFLENYGNRYLDILIDDIYYMIKRQSTEKDYDLQWDLRVSRADGTVGWIHDCAHYDSKLKLFFVMITDITDKMIETARDLSYDAFQARNEILFYMSKYTSEQVIVSDCITDQVVYMNAPAADLLGYKYESDWLGKQYYEIGFGSKENAPQSYYKALNENEFTTSEYYNPFRKMYCRSQRKIINVPNLNRKMRLNIITDITAQIKLERKIEEQNTLHNCVDVLFTLGATHEDPEKAYYYILDQIKTYYQADRAFFYKFKTDTNEIENIFELCEESLEKVKHSFPITATENQIELIKKLSNEKVLQTQYVLDNFAGEYKSHLMKMYKENDINSFSCITVNNSEDKILAFMGVVNPKANEKYKDIMTLLSRFICMFIEHEEDRILKKESSTLEQISNANLVEICSENFQNIGNPNKNIDNTLEALCQHYDADFALILMNKDDGLCDVSYIAGHSIPNLECLDNKPRDIIERWIEEFQNNSQFMSDVDVSDTTALNVKKILQDKFGIYNFIVSPIKNANGEIIGMLFVNNFKLLNRSRLMVHVVAKNISDYLDRISMHQKTHLEPATQLANKISTQNKISELLKEDENGTLFIIDIDNFKNLNDTLGHQCGDKAIVDIATILKKFSRTTDVVGRVGGDEFMMFCHGLTAENSINRKSQQIVENCNLHYEKDGRFADISVSVGACCVHENCNTFQSLYENADKALYKTKKAGKNSYAIYQKN